MYLPDKYSQNPNGAAFIPYSGSIFMMWEGWCIYQDQCTQDPNGTAYIPYSVSILWWGRLMYRSEQNSKEPNGAGFIPYGISIFFKTI